MRVAGASTLMLGIRHILRACLLSVPYAFFLHELSRLWRSKNLTGVLQKMCEAHFLQHTRKTVFAPAARAHLGQAKLRWRWEANTFLVSEWL